MIEEIDQWSLTSNYSHSGSGAADVLTANWAQFSADAFTEKGTGVTESSGIFSFPSTGYYEINYSIMISTTSNNSYFGGQIQATTNNSAYNTRGYSLTGSAGAGYYVSVMSDFIFRVADITNYKVRFIALAAGSATFLAGGTSDLRTSVRFKKLGGL